MDVEGVVRRRYHHDVLLLHHHRPEVQLAEGRGRRMGSWPLVEDTHHMEAMWGVALLVGTLQLPELLTHLGSRHLTPTPQHKVDPHPRHEH